MYLNTNKPLQLFSARGFTLIEMMIAMTITLVVSVVMVQLSAGMFQANSQSIQMMQLSQEMRSAMQLISRDVRRAGYNDDALSGFLSTQAIVSGVTMGTPVNGVINCVQVRYDDIIEKDKFSDREYSGIANVVYRLRLINGIGRISARFDDDGSGTCNTALDDDDWTDISDPLLMQITALEFVRDDSLTDIAENLDNGHVIQVGVEQVSITITASLRNNADVNRTITDEVQIRNQYLTI